MTSNNKRKKTIVILTHVNNDNSPYCSFVHEHAKALVKLGYNVTVFAPVAWIPILSNFQREKKKCWKNIKKIGKEIMIDGVKIIYKKVFSLSNFLYNSSINLNGIFYYLSIKNKFRKILKEENLCLVDAHTFKVEGYAAKCLKKKYGIPTTVTLHGTSFNRNLKNKNGIKSIKEVFQTVDYAVCVSDKLKNNLLSMNIKNSVVIYNGINTDSMIQKKKKFSILSVGNLVKSKNFHITIQSINQLLKSFKNIHLTIIGDGPEKINLQHLVDKLNIATNVTFTGNLSNNDVISAMGKSEIFLLPSSPEGFGIVYAEAMNNKCITIGTKGEGIDGFIKHGKNGFLVKSDIDEIENLIKGIYENKYDIENIIERGQNDAKKLTWEENAKRYINLIEG